MTPLQGYVVGLCLSALQWFLVSGDFTLTILHTNDVHARFMSWNNRSGRCTEANIKNRHCWGGAARRRTAVEKFRKEDTNVILLDAGDQFQGTPWYTMLRWEPVAKYMILMKYEVVTLGNHEFDQGVEGLEPHLKALKEANIEVVSANIKDMGTAIKDLFKSKTIREIGGQKIGIIGYTTKDTVTLASPGPDLEFEDEIPVLQRLADELTKEGVNKIIALGHSGILTDRQICQKVKGVDIVVGGHSNTFLYTPPDKAPIREKVVGPYPEVYTTTGSNCLVVQDFAFGQLLGRLIVVFDDQGVPKSWAGSNPVLIDSQFAEDQEMKELLDPYDKQVANYTSQVIGTTAVRLSGMNKVCRLQECSLGNIITDAAVFFFIKKTEEDLKKGQEKGPGWSDVPIGLWNGGGVRDFETPPWSDVTLDGVMMILPFLHTLEVVTLKGDVLRKVFEHSASGYSLLAPEGRFLQVSGVRVTYNMSKPIGERVVDLNVRCGSDCEIPVYAPVNDEKKYNVVTVTYVLSGQDGYTVLKDNAQNRKPLEALDTDVVYEYIKSHQPITTGIEGRITVKGTPQAPATTTTSRAGTVEEKGGLQFFFGFCCIRMVLGMI